MGGLFPAFWRQRWVTGCFLNNFNSKSVCHFNMFRGPNKPGLSFLLSNGPGIVPITLWKYRAIEGNREQL